MSACESKGAWQEGLTSWKLLRQETKGLKNTLRCFTFCTHFLQDGLVANLIHLNSIISNVGKCVGCQMEENGRSSRYD